jgi:hypothetical protein
VKKVKVTIDENIYTLNVFEVDKKKLTTNVKLEEGEHLLTKIDLLDENGKIIETKEMDYSFIVKPTFPFEIPIDFKNIKSGSFLMGITPTAKSPVYLKMPKDDDIIYKTAKFVGVLGVPDEDKHFYEKDKNYQGEILNKIKLKFAVHVAELNEDGSSLIQDEWFMYNWGDIKPLEVKWLEPQKNSKVIFILQFYYAFTDNKGHQHMSDVNTSVDGPWKIELSQGEDPVKDSDGFVNISFMPDENWLSDEHYKFYYVKYDD